MTDPVAIAYERSRLRSRRRRRMRDRFFTRASNHACTVFLLALIATSFGYFWAAQAYSSSCRKPITNEVQL